MSVGSKLEPAALDGYLRAKPDEPLFVLQGGDELAVRLVKVYIWLRRRAALKIENEKERNAELLRCAKAEEVLWSMEAYLKGESSDTEPEPEQTEPDEPAVVALHEYRVKAAGRISNAQSELEEIREKLIELGFVKAGGEADKWMQRLRDELKAVHDSVDPRRRPSA